MYHENSQTVNVTLMVIFGPVDGYTSTSDNVGEVMRIPFIMKLSN